MEITPIANVNSIIALSTFENKQLDDSKIGNSNKEIKADSSFIKEENIDIDFQDNPDKLEDFEKKLNKVNEQLQDHGVVLNYVKDEKTERMVVQLKDSNTNEVIKQMPSKEMLQIADNIDKFLNSYDKKGTVDKTVVDLSINLKA